MLPVNSDTLKSYQRLVLGGYNFSSAAHMIINLMYSHNLPDSEYKVKLLSYTYSFLSKGYNCCLFIRKAKYDAYGSSSLTLSYISSSSLSFLLSFFIIFASSFERLIDELTTFSAFDLDLFLTGDELGDDDGEAGAGLEEFFILTREDECIDDEAGVDEC